MLIKKICCIGADYLGGPLCSVLALKCPEIDVYVVDDNEKRVMQWNSGKLPVLEKGLEKIVEQCRDKNLFFTSNMKQSIKEADIIFICGKSPMKIEYSENIPDPKLVEDVARIIAETADSHKIVVEKTTMALRAAEMIKTILKANQKPDTDFQVLSNPEFFCEDDVIEQLLNPDRVLIGAENSAKGAAAAESLVFVYEHWVPRYKIFTTDLITAEVSKIATSAILAQKISSINSLSELCEETNNTITDVASIIGMDSRIGSKFLEPSVGFESPVLCHDLQNLVNLCNYLKLPLVAEYWEKILKMNEYQKKRFVGKIIQNFFNRLIDKKITIFGFSLKKERKESANSSGMSICRKLLDEGPKLVIFDPFEEKRNIKEALRIAFPEKESKFLKERFSVCEDPYEAAQGASGIVLCADWDILKNLDYNKIYDGMIKPAHIFDVCNFLSHKKLTNIGFQVQGLGKNLS